MYEDKLNSIIDDYLAIKRLTIDILDMNYDIKQKIRTEDLSDYDRDMLMDINRQVDVLVDKCINIIPETVILTTLDMKKKEIADNILGILELYFNGGSGSLNYLIETYNIDRIVRVEDDVYIIYFYYDNNIYDLSVYIDDDEVICSYLCDY